MKTKEVDIYYFTGTGNTLLAVKKLKEVLEKNDYKVSLFHLERMDLKKIKKIVGPVKKILRKKGYKPIGAVEIRMFSNLSGNHKN